MKRALLASVLVAAFAACGAANPKTATRAPQPTSRLEAAAQALVAKIPKDTLNKAAGFFAPVVKKYRPVFESFERDYRASTNKMAVIAAYTPKAEAALAEARAMKVPPRFQKEKDDYLRMAEAFAATLRIMVAFNR